MGKQGGSRSVRVTDSLGGSPPVSLSPPARSRFIQYSSSTHQKKPKSADYSEVDPCFQQLTLGILYLHLTVCASNHYTILATTYPTITYQSPINHQSFYPITHSNTHPSIQPLIYPLNHLSIFPSHHATIQSSRQASTHPSHHLVINYLSNHSITHNLYNHLSSHPKSYPPIYFSILQSPNQPPTHHPTI